MFSPFPPEFFNHLLDLTLRHYLSDTSSTITTTNTNTDYYETRTEHTMAWGRSGTYEPIGDEASDAEHKAGSPDGPNRSGTSAIPRFLRPAASIRPQTWWTTLSSAAAVILLGLFVFMPRPWLPADHPGKTHHVGCGNSTAEARAAGCKFDVMSYTWVQPACFDQELMYDFLGQDDWRWYPDEETAEKLTISDVADGQREYVYVTWEYYRTHCIYSKSCCGPNLPRPRF